MLTARLFGTISFQLGDDALPQVTTGRTAALLVYLAVTRQPQPRSFLADLLWDGLPDSRARTNLRYTLRDLRKKVGDYVVTEGEMVSFNQRLPHWVDATVFATHLAARPQAHPSGIEPQILQELLNLYAGEFLAGFQVERAAVFETWLQAQRRHLHHQYVQGLQMRIQQHVAAESLTAALTLNQQLLQLEPWREEAHCQQMILFSQTGQRSAALRQYEICCQALAAEFDLPPMPQTQTLFAQIKSSQWIADYLDVSLHREQSDAGVGRVKPTASEPSIPRFDLGSMSDPFYFYGRGTELATLRSWALNERSQLVAILGLNGQGKSALASVFVQESLEDDQSPVPAFDQVIWRSLHQGSGCIELLQEWVRQLGGDARLMAGSNFDQLTSQLFPLLQKQRCLLVLDGVEAVVGHASQESPPRPRNRHPDSERYEDLFRLFIQRRHQSCLLLTSQVRPGALTHLHQRDGVFRCLTLDGLGVDESAALLAGYGISGDAAVYRQIHDLYAGNPRLLEEAANLIYSFFNADGRAFLGEEIAFYGEIGQTLTRQLAQVSPLERQILHSLAATTQSMRPQTLLESLAPSPAKQTYLDALVNLQANLLIRQEGNRTSLPALMSAYMKKAGQSPDVQPPPTSFHA
ncbi:MAG: NACHT domain-containing protein [Caldilineaceae bacterium]|nr:NACHT domain-containing protein [Caldilineaceae bacterium]MBP8107217.1 NACHT domain-containing protein [Caldilineaceae bacterium]MBP8121385.1 NACHT domain-containing protein [Caldilineaceae bacterium]MBP9070690.1 NACHT domain-containing protein [Caldilineaceae bacterium]